MFQLINSSHQKEIAKIIEHVNETSVTDMAKELDGLIEQIRADIPEKKRISYGRYSIIKQLGLRLYPLLKESGLDLFNFAFQLFKNEDNDQFVRSLAIQLISIYGLETKDLEKVLPVFEAAATDAHWEMRECSSGFIRKLVKKYPEEMKVWYLRQAKSENPMLRRFSSESIRPVADNAWFKKHPEFAFSIISNLFRESAPYPRSSVGNNLSDWARIDKEKVYEIVEKLVNSQDKNAYWIAYRACRNLVKKEPLRVMDLLKTDEYKYKKRIHYRKDYMGTVKK